MEQANLNSDIKELNLEELDVNKLEKDFASMNNMTTKDCATGDCMMYHYNQPKEQEINVEKDTTDAYSLQDSYGEY